MQVFIQVANQSSFCWQKGYRNRKIKASEAKKNELLCYLPLKQTEKVHILPLQTLADRKASRKPVQSAVLEWRPGSH